MNTLSFQNYSVKACTCMVQVASQWAYMSKQLAPDNTMFVNNISRKAEIDQSSTHLHGPGGRPVAPPPIEQLEVGLAPPLGAAVPPGVQHKAQELANAHRLGPHLKIAHCLGLLQVRR